jgi:branched-chain amino acid transport system permease protein
VILFSVTPRSINPSYGLNILSIGPFGVSYARFACFIFSLFSLIVLYVIFTKTYFGVAVRSVIEDADAASIMGANVNKLVGIVYVLGCALAGVSGSLLGMVYIFNPYSGMTLLFTVISVIVLSGMGSRGIAGTFIGSFIIALIANLSNTFLTPGLVQASTYTLLLVLLILFPKGFGGGRA